MNAREQLEAAANWLGWQEEDLSVNLKTPEDALKLWQHWQKNRNLPEFADGQNCDEDEQNACAVACVAAIGYDPVSR